MKEQPTETRENGVEHSVAQRSIHATYEPPRPLPQFRARPKLIQVQLATKKQTPASETVKPEQNISEGAVDSGSAAPKKSS